MLSGRSRRAWLCVSCCLMLGVLVEGEREVGPMAGHDSAPEWGWELGSGSALLRELLDNFPADSPFVMETPGKPANCSQRFWLPSSSPVCWDNIARPEEFAQSRLLVLQNRAALQAVSTSSGVEEEGVSFDQQVRDEMQGIQVDHQNATETMGTMQKVLSSLEEKRKDGKEQLAFSSLKEQITSTWETINGREHMMTRLENQFSNLEVSFINMQHRLKKIMLH